MFLLRKDSNNDLKIPFVNQPNQYLNYKRIISASRNTRIYLVLISERLCHNTLVVC